MIDVDELMGRTAVYAGSCHPAFGRSCVAERGVSTSIAESRVGTMSRLLRPALSWYHSRAFSRSAEGTADRITGKKDNIVGAVTGDSSQQAAGQARHDKGETQQEINKRA